MAAAKQYTYQIKGNKLSLLEVDIHSSGDGLNYSYDNGALTGATSSFGTSGHALDIGGGSSLLTSPISSVVDGLEIEYAYSPTYTLSNTTFIKSIFGWGFRYDGKLGIFDVGSLNNIAAVGNKEYFKGTRWAGIQTGLQEGTVTTGAYYTAEAHISEQPPNKATQLVGITTDIVALSGSTYAYIIGDTTSHKNKIEAFKDMISDAEYYIHISGLASNDGIFKVQSSSTHGQIDIISKASGAENEYTFAAFTGTAVDGATNTTITYIHYSPGFQINIAVDTLNNEADTIDLPPYLSKALVYYVKAKLAEDAMEIEAKEYLMREFKRMVEKQASSNVSGRRSIMPGINAIR